MLTPRAGFRDLMRRVQGGSLDRGSADNLVQAPHIRRRLQRALNLKEMAPAPSVASEIQPVILVDDLTREKADSALDWYVTAEHTAAAGLASELEFFNPPGSGRHVRITAIDIQATASGFARWQKRSGPNIGTGLVNGVQTGRGQSLTSQAGNADVPFRIFKLDHAIVFGTGDSHPLRANSNSAPFFWIPLDLEVHENEIFAVQLGVLAASLEVLLECTSFESPP